ncbi:DNRLRE domain-containing protein [Microbispora hainanensis]|uniref:DNRLRE domain-containing protein n=1 Tax=Microbispora hainanensis TaxID=568844 RepID=A0A544XXQ9_9ACTN|nr:DNRLRE domain-containing protein [Microbispora hainanensis]TQS09298.1 DNRLRE domain-containing protein [Microbispora hainanensis]
MTVKTFDNTVARKVGGVGMVLQLTRADGGTAPAAAKVTVDYSSFRGAGGGGFASRLTLVRLPACVLAQPLTAECAKQRTAQQRVLPVVNDVKTGHLTAEVEVAPVAGGTSPAAVGSTGTGGVQATPSANASAGTAAAAGGDTAAGSAGGFVYAVAASTAATAEGSLVGDFSASPLKPSGTWQAGQSGGAFTYSYPITAPPAPSGDAPQLALQYSSAAVDSLTSQTNNGSGLVGIGWELNTGFIERSFVSCSGYAKAYGGWYNTAQEGWPDKCWESPYGDRASSKLTLSLDGRSTDIVQDTSGKWRTVEDYGWKIEPMSSQSWWRITTQDGTVYRFGYNTDSSLTMAFIGDDEGEPCYQYYPEPGSGEDSVQQLCEKPWRWMLDREVDPNGNVIDYSYDKEWDFYCTVALGFFESSCDPEYDRAVNVSEVSYGHNVNVANSRPTARIRFTTSNRASGGITDEPERCEDGNGGSDCLFGKGPVFYTSRKLTSITTQTLIPGTNGDWENVTRWNLSYQWLSGGGWNGDEYPILWLDSIQQTGLAGGNGTQIALPPTTFEAIYLDNAVSIELDSAEFPRINAVNNGLGGRSEVEYDQQNPCPEMAQYPPTDIWDDSGYDCYFITTSYDFINGDEYVYGEVYAKWLVKSVTDIDMVGGSPSQVTSYSYEEDPGWAIPDNPLALRDPLMPEDYTEWRGYGQVTTTVGGGSGSSDISTTSATFFRGLNRTVTDFDGNRVSDRIELNGRTLQEQTFDSNGENSSTRYEYKVTVTGTGPGTRDPSRVDQSREVTREKATTRWRYTDTKTLYNSDGLPDTVNDYGDTSTASDNTCTKITYARNATTWMLNYKASEEKHAGDNCAAGDLLSRSVTLYDGATDPASNTPTRGNATEIRAYSTATDYSTTKSTFDSYGRPLTTTEPSEQSPKTTTTTYAPAVGWPNNGVTVTNPLGHKVTTWSSQYNGQPVGMLDANNNKVNIDYDVLGRTLQLWSPDAPKPADDDTDHSDNPPAAKVAYTLTATQPSRTTVSHLQSGARTRTPTYTSNYTYSDGLGRQREVQTASPAGGRIVQVTTYNGRGLTERTSGPVYNSSAPGSGLLNPAWSSVPQWSKQEYDRLGRVTAQIDMTTSATGATEFRRTTTNYLGADKYEVIPPVGGKTVYYTDAADQVTKIEEWLSGGGSGQQTTAAAAVTGPVAPASASTASPATAAKTAQPAQTADPTAAPAANAPAAKQSPAQVQDDARTRASAEAKRSGKPVEVAALTSATSTTVANADGKTFTTTVSTRPTRVKRDGAWVPIDTSLVEKDGALVPKAGPAVTVSAGGDGPFATVADEAGNSIALSWPTPLPTPTVERNKARYVDAAGPGADLVVTVLPSGVRHDIELRERPTTQLNYRINVKTTGWKLQQDGQGRLTVTDSAGKLVAPVAQPVMYPKPTRSEKAGNAQAGNNANVKADAQSKAKDPRRRTGRITTRLTAQGDHQVLELAPDASFLADPTLTYPVTVDPTVDLSPQADTYVATWEKTVIHAEEYELYAGAGYDEIMRSYLNFDTAFLPGTTVTQAQLSLFNFDAPECGPYGSGIQARRVTSPWDPYTLIWNNQPTYTTEDAVTRRDAYSQDYCPDNGMGGITVTWDVTGIAQDWAAGQPRYGLQIRGVDESAEEDFRVYDSSELAEDYPGEVQGPELTVTYALPSSPAAGNLSITPVTGGAVSSLTPTLHATVSDTASGSLRADYQVEHDPAYTAESTGQIWTGSSVGVTSGNDAPAVVPAGKLSDGWHIRWRARATNTGASVSSSWSAWNTTIVSVPDPLVDQLQVTPSQVLSAETVTSTLTPALAARVTTPDAGASRVEFELEHDPADSAHGTGSIWTIGGAQAAAAKSAAVTAPASAASAPAVKESPAQVQDARVGASVEAKRSGKPVEVSGLASATSSTVANPDGKTFTTTVSTRPARIKRGEVWVPIDTSLVEKDGALVPKAGPAVTVSAGGDGPFATVADEAGNSIALSWPTPLPTPTVERNKARYVDAAGPGADLVVTVLPSGVRHDIELRERPTTQLNYRIGVKTTGWKLEQDGQGRLTLTDSAGKLVAPVAQPVMYPQLHRSGKTKDAKTGEDATSGAGTTAKANKGHRARSGRIATRLNREGDHQVLELTPDAAFLADPATSFPVVVDPTVNLYTQGDTYVGDWDRYSSWWDDEYLDVGSGTLDSGEIGISRGYLQFDTSALVGKSVTQAQLSLFNYYAPQCGAFGSGIQARRVTAAWDAYTITWNRQPSTTSEDAVTRQDAYDMDWCPDHNGGTITYDITAMAQDWAAGEPQYGVQLRAVDESGAEDWRTYDSMEATRSGAQPPTLTVTYSLPTSSPTLGNLSITPVSGGAVSSLTPTLHATVSDTVSGSLRADYEIEHDPAYTAEGTGQIWTGSSAGVTSGNDAPAVVPAGKLSNGWHIRWRARATNTGTSTSSSWSDWQTATITTVLDPVVDNVASGTQATLTVPAGKLGDGWKVRWRARAVAAGSNTSAWSDWQALTVKVPAATVSQLQITPAETVDGKTAVSSLTPQLLATVTDAYGQPLRAEFEVEHDPADTAHGTGGIWTGAADNVASGTQASVTVPGGALSNGWGIRWRARAVNTTTQVTSAWSDWQTATVNAANIPSEPGVSALQITPSQVVDNTTTATSLTPQLRAQVTNPAGGTLRAEFELEHDPAAPEDQGTGQIWVGAVDNVPAGTQAAVTVPTDTLSESWLVRWRARAVAGETASSWSDWRTVRVDQPDPVLGTLQVTPSEVVDGKTTSASLTPQLLAQVTDPAGGKVRAEFELEHDPAAPEGQGSGSIWATAVDDVTSGTQATATVPDGKLNDGWLVRWRARAITAGGTSAWSDWQQLTVVDGSQVLTVDEPRTQPVKDGTTNTLTPVLIAKVSTPVGGQLGAEFQVEHDPADTLHGTGQIWTTTVNGISSGNDAAVTIPTGTLRDGWKIRWRARATRGAATSDWTSWQSVEIKAAQHYDTTYEYDRDGRMTKQVDANGNVRTFTYDLLGRRTASHDPDAGDSQQAYDKASRLLWSTNGKGQKVSYSYDDLGRKTAIWSGERDSGTKLAEWTYDTVDKGKGELTSATRYVNGNAYIDAVTGYDWMGRPLGSTLTIPSSEDLLAGTYAFATTYSLTGQVETYTMPAAGGLPAETLTSTYTDLDLPQAMTSNLGGGFTYVGSTTYDSTGRLKERSYGANGKIKRELEWNPATGWLDRIRTRTQADTSGPVTAQDDRYEYDPSGEITKILDAAAASGGSTGQYECFTYDGLHRLSQAWTTTATACGTSTATADNQGIDPYAQSYTYDAVGNITSLTNSGQTDAYSYPQPGSSAVRPNAVSSITGQGGTDTYAYDAAGQLTSRTVGGKAGSFTWNELGQLDKATINGQDTTMVYDADGERLIRRDPGGKATLYLGSMEIEVNGSAITGKRYYTTPDGSTVAMRTGGDGVTWLMSGLHESTQLAVSDTTGKVSRERYLPFGQRRGADDLPFTDHGFLGKVEDDSTGLDYLTARYYDPAISKFISPDPLLDLREPQWANPFAYAGNNPIGRSDPSGLESMAPSGSGYCDKECQKRLQEQEKRAKEAAAALEKERRRLLSLLARYTGQCLFGMRNPDCESAREEVVAKLGYDPNAQSEGSKRAAAIFNSVIDFMAEDMVGCASGSLSSCALFAANFIPGEKLAVGLGRLLAAKAAEKLGPKLGKVAEKVAGGIEGVVSCNSFVPGTEVRMADGSHKPIELVKVGDKVLAADPINGRTEAKPVVALISSEGDKDLVAVTVDTDGSAGVETGVVLATDLHPFWSSDEEHWFNAKDLRAGMHLLTPAGVQLQILATQSYHLDHQRVYNLTIASIHAYHVTAGREDVLVHNASGGICGPARWIDDHGLNHSFDRHAGQWFGGEPDKKKLGEWKGLIERSMKSDKVVPWRTGTTDTYGHLMRVEDKWFFVQFSRSDGRLMTAFVPNNKQLRRILTLLK